MTCSLIRASRSAQADAAWQTRQRHQAGRCKRRLLLVTPQPPEAMIRPRFSDRQPRPLCPSQAHRWSLPYLPCPKPISLQFQRRSNRAAAEAAAQRGERITTSAPFTVAKAETKAEAAAVAAAAAVASDAAEEKKHAFLFRRRGRSASATAVQSPSRLTKFGNRNLFSILRAIF